MPVTFFANVQKVHTSAKYFFVSSQYISALRNEIDDINKTLVPLKGTMKVHQVIGKEKGIVLSSSTFCYCQDCLSGQYHDKSKHTILKTNTLDSMETENITEDHTNQNLDSSSATTEIECESEDWVLATYDNNLHVGQVKEIDKEYPDFASFFSRTKAKKVDAVTYK